MADIYSVSQSELDVSLLESRKYTNFTSFTPLLATLFSLGNVERDTNNSIVIVLGESHSRASQLDQLDTSDKVLLLQFFFKHLNVIVISAKDLANESLVREVNVCVRRINDLIRERISRVEIWTGTGPQSIEDISVSLPELHTDICEIVSTMSSVLNESCKHSPVSLKKLKTFHQLIVQEVNFFTLLSPGNTRPQLEQLCNTVGYWAFPAHELSNNDLVYCAYLILSYSLKHINPVPPELQIPSPNELLGIVFMVRDSYNSGNPFHNFRHAVDVLQACFHYVLRLGYLPKFEQFSEEPLKHCDFESLKNLKKTEHGDDSVVDLTPTDNFHKSSSTTTSLTVASTTTATIESKGGTTTSKNTKVLSSSVTLTPLQTLGLLVAALGHDVGHPGVTNAFLVKYDATPSLIYNEHSVLESFHASVFVNKILAVSWPSLLTMKCTEEMTIKNLIISSILATDMAEHFEYIDKLTSLKVASDGCESISSHKVRLVSSLLIKCADISNVTRPLRVSSQWAVVLKREFDEVFMLEEKITKGSKNHSVEYEKVPSDLEKLLEDYPTIHKGQLFFIKTFAEKLFDNIAELLPDLRYTCDIIQENKDYWLHRDKQVI
ncbi:hypothetical protein PGUG_04756 [Meyerozyma guilliermondii ATCC 6260]|uniref:Phosphodiesterase n=1 Tax=Meyerozyma guilliermondii (strain ATCC 6260 / CBS 566 / DSM 6381 / JCM 1539 / NBRC 10279 / NRRL Y-324) TaxID=294746 RepID=A5DNA5_PICGU|nr:uncharacterized protein PGUG_04756 [Meyerozyma guilliermondii ATCC 6260]EDK40658.2 hypothetical protein PGUG_04756 [Meyerozyma guilliermondii ATCC 6260]